ncbi:MAG: hypothetical protein E6772_09145 [Dysgonomonas sp.]|nr:hypothetical protein [Dysgonomonas sp.]
MGKKFLLVFFICFLFATSFIYSEEVINATSSNKLTKLDIINNTNKVSKNIEIFKVDDSLMNISTFYCNEIEILKNNFFSINFSSFIALLSGKIESMS